METETPLYKLNPSLFDNKPTFIYSIDNSSDEDPETYAYNALTLELININQHVEFQELKGELKVILTDTNILVPTTYPGKLYIYDDNEPLLLFWIPLEKIFITMNGRPFDLTQGHNLYECKIPELFISNGERFLKEKCFVENNIQTRSYPQISGKNSQSQDVSTILMNQPSEQFCIRSYETTTQKVGPMSVNNESLSPSSSPLSPTVSPSCLQQLASIQLQETGPLSLKDLSLVVESLIKRIYQIYPISMPKELIYNNEKISLISWSQAEKLKSENKIVSHTIEPLLQPFAGSHRNNNRMILIQTTDNKKYYCQVKYDNEKKDFCKPETK